MKTTVKQSPALARTGALTLAILLGFSAAALPAQAQTAGKSKTAATKKAPQASSRSGDYIVAIVNSVPVTNHEVNRRASILTGTCKRCGVSGVCFKIGPTTAISAARSAQTAKIATQQLAAFIRQDPSRHVKPMIQARVGIQIV